MEPTYTSRRTYQRHGREGFAEITVRADEAVPPSIVTLSDLAMDQLRALFGSDVEHYRHCVHAAVSVQIDIINVAGEMPHAGATAFRAEVTNISASMGMDSELAGFLLSVASMDAIAEYLQDWENEREQGR